MPERDSPGGWWPAVKGALRAIYLDFAPSAAQILCIVAINFTFDPDKAIAAIVYLAGHRNVAEFDKYKAAKLLFLAEKYHLVRFGRTIFGDYYKALDYGPIPQSALDLIGEVTRDGPERSPHAERLLNALEVDRSFRYPRMKAAAEPQMDVLSRSDVMALDHVADLHGRKTFDELKALTHEMPAYRKAWKGKLPLMRSAGIKLEHFFEEDPDAVQGAYEEMVENDLLERALSVGGKL